MVKSGGMVCVISFFAGGTYWNLGHTRTEASFCFGVAIFSCDLGGWVTSGLRDIGEGR
jgi:hypothetical protein